MTGSITSGTTNIIKRSVDNSYMEFFGGTAYNKGAYFKLYGASASDPATFEIHCNNGTNDPALIGKVGGTLTWNTKTVTTDDKIAYVVGSGVTVGTKVTESYSNYVRIGKIIIVSICLNIGTAMNTDEILIEGLPTTAYDIAGSMNKTNGYGTRIWMRKTHIVIDGGASTGWYNGNLIYAASSY